MTPAQLREELKDTRYVLRHLLNALGAETMYEAEVHNSGDPLAQAYVLRAYQTPVWRELHNARAHAYRHAWDFLYRRLGRAPKDTA